MKKIAIVYDSVHGQTDKIAHYMESYFQRQGLNSQLIKVSDRPLKRLEPEIDGVIIGSPVYAQKFRRKLLAWARAHKEILRDKPIGLFSVSLNAADPRPTARKAEQDLLQTLIHQTELSPRFIVSMAGALKYRDYNWLIRFIMKRISAQAGGSTDTSQNHEYTDWQKIDAFLSAYLEANENSEFAVASKDNHNMSRNSSNPSMKGQVRSLSPEQP